MKKLLLAMASSLMLMVSFSAWAEKLDEAYYQDIICHQLNGVAEVKQHDGTRIDCETETLAMEIDFQPKLYECIGQAILYSSYTGKQATCLLIVNGNSDIHVTRAERIIAYIAKSFRLMTLDQNTLELKTVGEYVNAYKRN